MAARTVDPLTLKSWLDSGEAVLIDVREPAEHKAESIAKAVSVPLGRVEAGALPATEGRKLVVHCLKGGRAASACAKLLGQDSSLELYNLEGGIAAWNAQGLPTVKSGSFSLPLDRQVQLTIGGCVLMASVLAIFVNPAFAFVAAFFGAGLTVAGATGFCGLARLMALAPWNQAA